MLTFYFVRHGQTQSNIEHTLQGWCDTPLTPLGIKQAITARERYKDIEFLAVYSSPSKRAYETAHKLCPTHQVILLDGLKEMNFGRKEGCPEDFEGCHTSMERIEYDWHRYGGETIEDLCKRMSQTLHTLVETYSDKTGNILCVSHGFAILAVLRAIDISAYHKYIKEGNFVQNCAALILCYEEGQFICKEYNIV